MTGEDQTTNKIISSSVTVLNPNKSYPLIILVIHIKEEIRNEIGDNNCPLLSSGFRKKRIHEISCCQVHHLLKHMSIDLEYA